MLIDAESIGQNHAQKIAKQPPPSSTPQITSFLEKTNSWISVDLNTISAQEGQTVLETLANDSFWRILQDIGLNGMKIQCLKEGGKARTGFDIDAKWGAGWDQLKTVAASYNIALIGDLIGAKTGSGEDFSLAVQNVKDFRQLYHLIEILPEDWPLLPKVPIGMNMANIPWLTLNELNKKGYIPEAANPYINSSAWNATGNIKCRDGKERRWIYLKDKQNEPLLSWLTSSFGADRIASADALDSLYRLGQKALAIDAMIPSFAQENLALWIRKIGGYSIQSTNGTLREMQAAKTDAIDDAPTRQALLHAMSTENAEALRLIYRLYLQQGIQTMRLVHSMEPFSCDWAEFLMNPGKYYLYGEEKITGQLLRERLLKEDLAHLQESSHTQNWSRLCSLKYPSVDIGRKSEEIQKAHLLLAFTYAMQPGIFSLTLEDLLGDQIKSPSSFASHLKKILAIRAQSTIAMGELIDIPPSANRSVLLLLHRLPKSYFFHLLAVNFGKSPVQEKIMLPAIQDTWAIDLMEGKSVEKELNAGVFFFELPPLSGKAFLFQPKYYQ
ncbi:MAG TPA: hypothetical protein VLE95_04840 [Chlamydiales bacterium]|nr:hypothetical protein [Chlamydiales bacterium]